MLVVEAPLPLGVVGHEGVVALLSHDARLHQVVDELGGALVLLQLLLVLLQLALGILERGLMSRELTLHLVEPGHLGAEGVLLLEVRLLGVSYLGLRTPSLGAGLEHVHAGAVEHTGLGGGLEGSCYLRVHLYRQPTLDDHLLVPHLNLLLHPVGEGLLEHGVDDVADPLLAHLHHLLAVGQVIVYLRVLVGELCDVLESQALVSRDGDVPDVGPVDLLLGSGDLVLEEVDRDLICNIKQKGEQLPY